MSNYLLLLAHQVLTSPIEYERFYREELADLDPFIIMDNSLIELGTPLPMKDVVIAAQIVGAKVIVLPDMLGMRLETLKATIKGLSELYELKKHAPAHEYIHTVKTLGVAQGQTFNDVFSCARDMILDLRVDMVSIPRHVTAKIGSRIEITTQIAKYKRPIHLLGFSDNLLDDVLTLRMVPEVMGIDSAVPVWLGLQGLRLPSAPPEKADYGSRPPNYDEETVINHEVVDNIKRVERWVNTASDAPTGR